MVDETATALRFAGPTSWHHLIAPTRTFPLTDSTIRATALSMDSAIDHPRGIEAIPALAELASTANILANAIANSQQVAGAQSIFKLTRTTAHILDIINKDVPSFTPKFSTYRHFRRAAETRDHTVLSMLLIDVIRIANHITES